jgi:rhamnose transport system ATP-binding protein
MVGRELEAFFVKEDRPRGKKLLSVRGLSKEGAFSDISFDIHEGEVLGFAGLVGARRTDVGLALFGIAPADAGEVELGGKTFKVRSPEQAMKLGIAYVPEDRRQQGLTMPMSITANITLPMLKKYLIALGIIKRGAEQATAEQYRQQLSIRTSSILLEVSKLSGGNQQKVVLGKWLNTKPRLLILDEPTRGIDVGAKAEVHSIINDLAAQGLGIMLISSDLPEVLAMSDRILVMREGRQMGIFSREEANQEVVMTAAMGAAMGQAQPIAESLA